MTTIPRSTSLDNTKSDPKYVLEAPSYTALACRAYEQSPWARNNWRADGMLCVMTAKGSWEIKPAQYGDRPAPGTLAVGCGGWNQRNELLWFGIDLDVGHGQADQSYGTLEDALAAAKVIREFVGGAAEIRLSKSGRGVHVRIPLQTPRPDGRRSAPVLAKWIARKLNIKCDHTVLGRQNFWFWASNRGERRFELVHACQGSWEPPSDACEAEQQEKPKPDDKCNRASEGLTFDTLPEVQEWLIENLETRDPAIEGNGGHKYTYDVFNYVLDYVDKPDDAYALIRDHFNPRCIPPWPETGGNSLRSKLDSALDNREHRLGYKYPETLAEACEILDHHDNDDFLATEQGQTQAPQCRWALENYEVVGWRNTTAIKSASQIEQISVHMLRAFSNWPRRNADTLFHDDGGQIRYLETCDDAFAWFDLPHERWTRPHEKPIQA